MLRRLIILLLIVVGFSQEQEMDALEKQMLYKQNDRSPLIAGLCALTPSIGHFYMGKWKRGLGSLLLFSGGFFIGSVIANNSNSPDRDMWFIAALPFYYLQLQDAIYLAYQHNADLYEEIYGKEYIRPPKKSIIQKWIDKKEAKKKAKTDK